MVSRLLAASGALVTLIGVALLLVLAAQAGWFGPAARVSAGGVLALALLGASAYVRHGDDSTSSGVRAGVANLIAGTGFAAAILDVVAVTTIYGWLAPTVGLAAAFILATTAVLLAVRWDSESLAALSVAGVAALSPVITGGFTIDLVTFLIVLQLGAAQVHWVKPWHWMHGVRTVPVVIAASVSALMMSTTGESYRALIAVAAVAVVGVITGVAAAHRYRTDQVAGVLLALAQVPLIVWVLHGAVAELPNAWSSMAVAGAAAVMLNLIAVAPQVPQSARSGALVAGVAAMLAACIAAPANDARMFAILAFAAGYFVAGGFVRSRITTGVGVAFSAVGWLWFLNSASPEILTSERLAVRDITETLPLASVAVLLVAGLGWWSAWRLGLIATTSRSGIGAVVAMVSLHSVTAFCVSTGVLAAGAGGFIAGHTVATVVWMLAATALLLWAVNRDDPSGVLVLAGLGLSAAAIAKLFLYDLAALDGMARVAGFIVVGVLLLGLGTRYARGIARPAGAAGQGRTSATAETQQHAVWQGQAGAQQSGV